MGGVQPISVAHSSGGSRQGEDALHEPLAGITYQKTYVVADVVSEGAHRGDNYLSVGISPRGMLMVAALPLGRTLVVCDLKGIQNYQALFTTRSFLATRPDGYIGFVADPWEPAAFDRYFGLLFA